MNMISTSGNFIWMAGICFDRLRPPNPAGLAGARRGKRLSPKWEAGSPVAAVYDRRNRTRCRTDRWSVPARPTVGPTVRESRGFGVRRGLAGGHRPPLQNTVWAQRDSTGSGCLRLLKQRPALHRLGIPLDCPPLRGGLRALPFFVGSELARAVGRSASKLADPR